MAAIVDVTVEAITNPSPSSLKLKLKLPLFRLIIITPVNPAISPSILFLSILSSKYRKCDIITVKKYQESSI